jgi:membrane associated rhomboid family serine protease
LVAVNVLVFCLGVTTSWGVGPGTGLLTVVTYGFVHYDLWHLMANMWILLVFGNAVNRRLGNGWYLLAYLGTILTLGLFARLCVGGLMVGASGGIFAMILIALMLMPKAKLEIGYFALFPLTVLVGLIRRPTEWLFWLVRWGQFSIRAYWCLLLVPLMELGSLVWSGWNWGTVAHLLGMLCGVAVVLLLPTRISMPGRAVATGF